ncbi:MAG: hypothetical protein ACE14S_07220 [Candidatus Bathyarchaeia archaeon]
MKTSIKLTLVALLALGIGVAYASPMLITPMNIQPLPRVLEGPKAEFSVNVVYANFSTTDWQYTYTEYDEARNPTSKTDPATNLTYNVVLNVTNISDKPATVYEVAAALGKDISVQQSILGGSISIYDTAEPYPDNGIFPSQLFGGIVDGVYLDGKWVNITWIPEGRYLPDGTWQSMPYPDCLTALTQAFWRTYWHGVAYDGAISGPLNPDEVRDFSANHAINGTVPNLPANASETGVWFEGVPIAEYYDLTGNPLITEMYINGSWVDVTGRVTVDNMQPFMIGEGMLINIALPLGWQPTESYAIDYYNKTGTAAPIATLPRWGSWGGGRGYAWIPGDWGNYYLSGFNSTWGPHESRLIIVSGTQMHTEGYMSDKINAALESGKLKLYSSVSNYVNVWPVNGTYYNTASTAIQTIQLQLEKTPSGYVYNAILADDQTFQPGKSSIEVTIAPRTQP